MAAIGRAALQRTGRPGAAAQHARFASPLPRPRSRIRRSISIARRIAICRPLPNIADYIKQAERICAELLDHMYVDRLVGTARMGPRKTELGIRGDIVDIRVVASLGKRNALE